MRILIVNLLLASMVVLPAAESPSRRSVLKPPHHRKALVIGRGEPFRERNGGHTHPQLAKDNFLKLVGNPENDPGKGWTCDLSWDLMVQLGMNPTNTPLPKLFAYLGTHDLGYRIVMQNSPAGQRASFWGAALDNGMLGFAPHYDNTQNKRVEDSVGLRACVGVGGGSRINIYTYGPSLEVFDALPVWASHANFEDAAQSWANQVVAAKVARIMDAHPEYNIWDARQHMRQAASFWKKGWSERNGYGRVDPDANVGKLLPGPPVEFRTRVSRTGRKVTFTWRNFLMSDFAATVIALKDGPVLYRGTGTNFVWASDRDGKATFEYWSENKAGERSRMEAYQTRIVDGLQFKQNRTFLLFGAEPPYDYLNKSLRKQFRHVATNWTCDIVYRPGNPTYDTVRKFPVGNVMGVLPNVSEFVDFAISNDYRIIMAATGLFGTTNLHRSSEPWRRAVDHGIAVVLPHAHTVAWEYRSYAEADAPKRLCAAITVGRGSETNRLSGGPGLEIYDDALRLPGVSRDDSENSAAAVVAAKLALIFDAHPDYNVWDARQFLRQSSSRYAQGWTPVEAFGRPSDRPTRSRRLDPAPPVEIRAVRAADGKSVRFSWCNFAQSGFVETVIQAGDGRTLYAGTGTQFEWPCDLEGEQTFIFRTRTVSGELSRPERCAMVTVAGLVRAE